MGGKLLLLLFALLSPIVMSASSERDTLGSGDIMEYEDMKLILSVFDGSDISEVINKVDLIVKTGKTPEEIARMALYAYDYYMESLIMGYDEVAIYVANNYFLNGAYKLPPQRDMTQMKLYCEFNRSSLLGMQAPEFQMQDIFGNTHSLYDDNQEDYTVLYFYDDQCPTCRKSTLGIMQYMTRVSGINFSLYMIYVGDDMERWREYIRGNVDPFHISESVKLVHLWDPEIKSDYPMKYGVISTPSLFLLDRDHKIIGRGLDPAALAELVNIHRNTLSATEMVLNQIFIPLAQAMDTTAIYEEIDGLFNDSKDNPEFFNELFYTMYQLFKGNIYYSLQMGAAYLAEKYIVGMPLLWSNISFTETGVTHGSVIRADYDNVTQFLNETALAVDLFYRNPLGSKVENLLLYDEGNKRVNLHDIDGEWIVLYFYSMDCGVCNAVTKELRRSGRSIKKEVLLSWRFIPEKIRLGRKKSVKRKMDG